MDRLKVGIIFGGCSEEHPISVKSPDRSGLLVLEQGRYEAIGLDVVLPVLHGGLGEDGAIQGLFELAGIKSSSTRSTRCPA